MLSWIRDAILAKVGVDDSRLINIDRVKDLKRFISPYSLIDLEKIKKEVIKAWKIFNENLNIKIQFLAIKEKFI